MKKSKKAIEELFRNERDSNEFLDFLKEYFSGELDPYKPKNWVIYEWDTFIGIYDMDMQGAERMKSFNREKDFAFDITENFDDDSFHSIVLNKDKAGLMMWMMDIVGLKYKDMVKFDPYKYDAFNEYITMYGDDGE